MATTNLGRIAIVPKGDWAAGTYKYLDLVRYSGSSYIVKIATTTALPTDTTAWAVVASDGAQGPAGAQGPLNGNAVTTGKSIAMAIVFGG
jgi:hypothetical protein